MYFKYQIQNTKKYLKYVFEILVFEILPSTGNSTTLIKTGSCHAPTTDSINKTLSYKHGTKSRC